jgi:hypothetical protein
MKFYLYEVYTDRETGATDIYKYRCQEKYAGAYDTVESALAAAAVAEPEDFSTTLTVLGFLAQVPPPLHLSVKQ